MRRAAFVARDLSKRSMMAGSVRLAHTVRNAEMPAHSMTTSHYFPRVFFQRAEAGVHV